MQQLLDAAELLAPGEPGDSEVPGGTEASGASGATSPTSSSLLSWTAPGVNALAGLKQSVKDTSAHVVSQAYRAAGYGGKPETPLTPSMDPVEVYGRIEDTVETLVLLLLDPVLKGIPSLGILPARVEARRSAGIPKQIFETPGCFPAVEATLDQRKRKVADLYSWRK
ncbi:Cation channel sperm-associated protein 1 [Durusdinium trenchii]|uniref:Cation channel sperm-associated protein 1 n=1 Tax=Durusdinium trenchii TaxID=1381693 RepID=A0ABP0SAX0_9DINO